MAKIVLKAGSNRVKEMQRDPQEYFRKARELAKQRADAQLKAEQQRRNSRSGRQTGSAGAVS